MPDPNPSAVAAESSPSSAQPASPETSGGASGSPAQPATSSASPAAPKKPETREEKRARLKEASRLMREERDAKRAEAATPAAAASGAPAATASTSTESATPAATSGDKKPLDAWAKVADAQRKHELAKQELARAREAFTAEGETRKADLERATRYSPLEQLIKDKKHRDIMQLVYGDGWREAWLEMTTDMAPEPPKPLSEADARRVAAEEHARLLKEDQEKAASDMRTRVEHGLKVYMDRVLELAKSGQGKYHSSQARGSFRLDGAVYDHAGNEIKNRDRLTSRLQELRNKTGQLPDPQAFLDEIDAEDTAFFRQALPYAGQAALPADAASGPAKTITPALRQGGLPPSSPGSLTLDQDREARRARLAALSSQQRQQQT